MSNALISVIVPVYKVEKYLPICIESILNQSYRNLEIILIDDGSPDNCPEICDAYARKDKRIKVIHKKNGGLSSARNAGISIAKGDFIAFVDGDDYLEKSIYEKLIVPFEDKFVGMTICGMRYVNEKGATITRGISCPIKNEILDKEQAFSKLVNFDYFYYVTAVNKLYKKDIFRTIRFPEGRINEDEFVAHYIIDAAQKIGCIQEELYNYVQREQSIMHEPFTIKRLDGVWALYDRYTFFQKYRYKTLAKKQIRKTNYAFLNCINRLGVLKYRKEYKDIKRKIIVALKADLRVIKLLFSYYKRLLKDVFIKRGENL